MRACPYRGVRAPAASLGYAARPQVDSALTSHAAGPEVGDWRALDGSGPLVVLVKASHLFLMAPSMELEVTSSHSGVYKTRQANDQHDRGSGATHQTLRGP